MERGKYAQLCVEVDLTKPLLAMFNIEDRMFKLEYEGMHMLCLTCGRFGHFKDGCLDKNTLTKEVGVDARTELQNGQVRVTGGDDDGPWSGVHKHRRGKKVGLGKHVQGLVKIKQGHHLAGTSTGPQLKGSRLASLSEDMVTVLEQILGDQLLPTNEGNVVAEEDLDTMTRMETNGERSKKSGNKSPKPVKISKGGKEPIMHLNELFTEHANKGCEDGKGKTMSERRKLDLSGNKRNISSLATRGNTSFKIKNHGADKTITSFHKSVVVRDGGSSSTSIPPDKEQELLEGSKDTNTSLQGAASNVFYRYCNQYIRMYKPKVADIMEIRCDPKKLESPLKSMGFDKNLAVNNNGYAGGLVIAWQSCSFNIEEIIKSPQLLHVVIKKANMNEWYFTAVYASPSDDRRKVNGGRIQKERS
ncbi:uncharacterized protein LOC131605976 [Vicia villosa]|uniref:uncharacterized protein LOC131605976 n=1 Tax=Vicia villosa TaxID=3911 RepID=UPI00273CBEC9|nr:uncharacterized protein LOC131605976 [Vicia villosa]